MLKELNFSEALTAMKAGNRVSRTSWNIHSQWVCLGQGGTQTAEAFWNLHTRMHAESMPERRATVLPYFILKNPEGDIQMGWSPSQSDALAEDWEIV